jgi:hypothetical protein
VLAGWWAICRASDTIRAVVRAFNSRDWPWVVIHPDPKATGTIDLSGTQCASGKAVRFCYDSCDWIARLQRSVVTLAVNVGRHLDYTGYMVFPGPGWPHWIRMESSARS